MSDITGTTRAQTLFLRAYAKNPAGPLPNQWPAPAILRKWMRKPRFRHALQTIRDTYRFQSDLQLATASALAVQALTHTLSDPAQLPPDLRSHVHALSSILRLAHSRQRFATPDPELPDPTPIPTDPPAPRLTEPAISLRALQQLQPHRKVRGLLYYLRRDHPEYFSNNPPPILIHPTT